MAREEKQANIYAIPKNSFDTGYVFGGQFKTRNFVEGVVVPYRFLESSCMDGQNSDWTLKVPLLTALSCVRRFSSVSYMAWAETACLSSLPA